MPIATPARPSPGPRAAPKADQAAAAAAAANPDQYRQFLEFLGRNLENCLGHDHPSFKRY